MKPNLILTLPLCFVGLLGLQGCAGVLAGAGATAGVAAVQEGGLSRAAKDALIQTQINDLWFRYNTEMFTKLDMTVNNGRVLLTGVVQNPEHRVEAVRLAWQPKGVTQVINEITVADGNGIAGFARDAWISGRLRTALMFDKNVLSVNFSIDTVNRVIYLMGWAQDQAELNRVMEIARTISDVEQVVSYVKLVGEKDDPVARSTITSQQYAKPPETFAQSDVAQDPVVVIPPPEGYPNVKGHEPVLTDSDSGVATTDVIRSENLLWEDRR